VPDAGIVRRANCRSGRRPPPSHVISLTRPTCVALVERREGLVMGAAHAAPRPDVGRTRLGRAHQSEKRPGSHAWSASPHDRGTGGRGRSASPVCPVRLGCFPHRTRQRHSGGAPRRVLNRRCGIRGVQRDLLGPGKATPFRAPGANRTPSSVPSLGPRPGRARCGDPGRRPEGPRLLSGDRPSAGPPFRLPFRRELRGGPAR